MLRLSDDWLVTGFRGLVIGVSICLQCIHLFTPYLSLYKSTSYMCFCFNEHLQVYTAVYTCK